MTTAPKAPLPDEVAEALDFLHSYAQFNHRALIHRDNLRAHIAAQVEKIAVLEKCLQQAQDAAIELAAKNVKLEGELLSERGMRRCEMAVAMMTGSIAKLEADNKRLREAAHAALMYIEGSAYYGIEEATTKLKAALAPAGKAAQTCKTCEGRGVVRTKSEHATLIECAHCNGTGRKVE